jgi:hypothetical protein
MEPPKHFFKAGGELGDYPGWYKIDLAILDRSS